MKRVTGLCTRASLLIAAAGAIGLTTLAQGDCEPGAEDALIRIELLTDDFPAETTIELVEQGGKVVFSAGPFPLPNTLHVFEVPVCSTICYDFTIFDSFADGICCGFGVGSYSVFYEGDLICSGGNFGASETCSGIGDDCKVADLCEPGAEDAIITIEVLTDDFPGETTIEVVEQGGRVAFSAGPFADPNTLHVFEVPVCSAICYDFTISDSFGDGICCGLGLGSYSVFYEGDLVCSGGDFDDLETCSNIGDGCRVFCEPGAEDALITIELLTDDFPADTTIELVEQGGKVVFSAGPFPLPNTLHVFEVPVCSTSCYDFTIFDSFGDGICCGFGVGSYSVFYEGDLICSGGNFGASETCSDIACAKEPCAADLTRDGLVNAADLATLLGAWGPNPGHPADFNRDGVVNAADLATLLGAWGPCP